MVAHACEPNTWSEPGGFKVPEFKDRQSRQASVHRRTGKGKFAMESQRLHGKLASLPLWAYKVTSLKP